MSPTGSRGTRVLRDWASRRAGVRTGRGTNVEHDELKFDPTIGSDPVMACSKLLLAVSAILFAVTAGAHEATARQRAVTRADWSGAPDPGLAPRDFCGGRLPGYGLDACGYPEVGY